MTARAAFDLETSPLHYDPLESQAYWAWETLMPPTSHSIKSATGSVVASEVTTRQHTGHLRARIDGKI